MGRHVAVAIIVQGEVFSGEEIGGVLKNVASLSHVEVYPPTIQRTSYQE